MLLSARMLSDVQGVNSFEYVDQLEFSQGDLVTVFFQLVDRTKDRMEKGFVPAGRRYVPVTGASLQVTLTNLDGSKQITKRQATPAFFGKDNSIWSVPVAQTDLINGTVDMILYLTEGAVVTTGRVVAALAIQAPGALVP